MKWISDLGARPRFSPPNPISYQAPSRNIDDSLTTPLFLLQFHSTYVVCFLYALNVSIKEVALSDKNILINWNQIQCAWRSHLLKRNFHSSLPHCVTFFSLSVHSMPVPQSPGCLLFCHGTPFYPTKLIGSINHLKITSESFYRVRGKSPNWEEL